MILFYFIILSCYSIFCAVDESGNTVSKKNDTSQQQRNRYLEEL